MVGSEDSTHPTFFLSASDLPRDVEVTMTHGEKIDHLIADLQERGVRRYDIDPPLFRVLWSLGIQVAPPLFLGFFSLMAWFGLSFGGLWGVAMWFIQWRGAQVRLSGLSAAQSSQVWLLVCSWRHGSGGRPGGCTCRYGRIILKSATLRGERRDYEEKPHR
jgi:hypothetical protein